ncbi:MAG: protein kinase [Pyrinomonadaceae bacterium]
MAIASGTELGQYKILSPLGTGGMGEVYRARDTLLDRDVAVKVLPTTFATDQERLRLFSQEARAGGAISHPNILSIYYVGTHDDAPFVVSELLEGETLRRKMDGEPLAPRKAVEYAIQIAHGLAAAHDKGIVHRDIKPENIFVCKDGRVKILDFGLAKLSEPPPVNPSSGDATTEIITIQSGLMGTVGYMSPEHVRGALVDHRSDIFSLGIVLYEMLSGKRPFQAETKIEVQNAILRNDPPDLSEQNKNISPALWRIVRHCLEKSPEERFQSARDLAFDLESLSSTTGQAAIVSAGSKRKRWLWPLAIALIILASASLAYLFGKRAGASPPPVFRQITFRRGTVWAARFAPDGQNIIYSATWDAAPRQIFSARSDSPESRNLGLPAGDILALSSSGEMAILLSPHGVRSVTRGVTQNVPSTLARVPLAGGAPREILEDVTEADWSPDGQNLAVVRIVGGRNRLEYPIGKVLYETVGWISNPRISPKGDRVAFMDHPTLAGDRGSIATVDLSGNRKTVSSGWTTEYGLAWSPDGEEIWFTATAEGGNADLHAVTPAGKERLVERVAGRLILYDISRDGRILLARANGRHEMPGLNGDEKKERDLAWLDQSFSRDLSHDGKLLLFDERGEGGGPTFSVYLRKTDGSPAIRLGEGAAMALSPDGKQALSFRPFAKPPQLVLLPAGAGETRALPNEGIDYYHGASWFPDSKRILFIGNENGRSLRCFVQDLESGKTRPVTPEGVTGRFISPDGKLIFATDAQQQHLLYGVDGGEPNQINGLAAEDEVIGWNADGRALYVYRPGELPIRVYRLDLATGRKEQLRELMPSDPAGVDSIETILLTPDGKSYVYTYRRNLSDLFMVEGLK